MALMSGSSSSAGTLVGVATLTLAFTGSANREAWCLTAWQRHPHMFMARQGFSVSLPCQQKVAQTSAGQPATSLQLLTDLAAEQAACLPLAPLPPAKRGYARTPCTSAPLSAQASLFGSLRDQPDCLRDCALACQPAS